jgi:hypothetical protein
MFQCPTIPADLGGRLTLEVGEKSPFLGEDKRDRHACVRIVQVPQPTLDEKLGVDDHYGKNSDSKTYRKIMYRKIPDATDAISEVASAKTKGGA